MTEWRRESQSHIDIELSTLFPVHRTSFLHVMSLEMNFNEENIDYQLSVNGPNPLLGSSRSSSSTEHNILQERNILQGGAGNLPRHMVERLEPIGLRRTVSWGPYQHTGTPTTEDWSNNNGTLSQMGSRATSHFSVDPYQSGIYQEHEEARRKILVLETQLDTMTLVAH